MDSSSSSFPGSSSTSFVILSVSIVGILSTALLLLAYYLFLTRCGLLFFWRPDLQLQLQDHHRVSVTVHQEQPPRPPRSGGGLEDAAIRRIPTLRYRHDANKPGECAVCLGDFRDGERLRLLPACRHAFHIDCIDAWLSATANCPLCRAAVVDHPAPAASCAYHHLPLPASVAGNVIIDIAAEENAAGEPTEAEQAAAPDDRSSSTLSMPMRARRSLSMDSSTDKRFYLALQRIIQHQQEAAAAGKGERESSAATDRSSRRLRRSFFSFSQSRGSRSAILPL